MRTKDEAKSLIESWGKKAGLDDAGIKALVANDDILEEAKTHLARHDEMSSGIDRAKNEAKSKLDELTKWYNEVAQPSVAEASKLKAAHQKYRDQFGDLDEIASPANPKFASKADLDTMVGNGYEVNKQYSWMTADYNSKFGPKYGSMEYEQLAEIEKLAVSRGIPPIQAYREWVAPKNKEISEAKQAADNAAVEARIKAAKEEGYKEGQSRGRQYQGESTRTNSDVFNRDLDAVKLAKTNPDDADAAGDRAFIDAWNKWDETHAAAS